MHLGVEYALDSSLLEESLKSTSCLVGIRVKEEEPVEATLIVARGRSFDSVKTLFIETYWTQDDVHDCISDVMPDASRYELDIVILGGGSR